LDYASVDTSNQFSDLRSTFENGLDQLVRQQADSLDQEQMRFQFR
jgi:hypothetical protein